ncbi:MAG: hypothetical protein II288_04690, partial [Alistipes sp.]|nr:hypothetical protein [Alistipes sp.]
MTFSTSKGMMANLTTLPISRVKEIIAINRAGQKVETLLGDSENERVAEPTYRHEEDSITRFDNKSKSSKRNKRRGSKSRQKEQGLEEASASEQQPNKPAEEPCEPKEQPKPQAEGAQPQEQQRRGRNDRRRGGRNRRGGDRTHREAQNSEKGE